jgi:hypothetical protein
VPLQPSAGTQSICELPARAQAHEQIVLAQLQAWPQAIHVRPQSSDGCIWSADLCHYLNPNDLTNRVFLHYAGEEIHFDAALATLPSDILRAVLVAKNPKAQSDFFRPTSKGSSDTSSVGTWTKTPE